ncbi:MAG TPA: hypothetical protein VLH40_07775 [Atribacteraceae bacterium]|nr:hypothetical protein [Atribacteraceae bacterium]
MSFLRDWPVALRKRLTAVMRDRQVGLYALLLTGSLLLFLLSEWHR